MLRGRGGHGARFPACGASRGRAVRPERRTPHPPDALHRREPRVRHRRRAAAAAGPRGEPAGRAECQFAAERGAAREARPFLQHRGILYALYRLRHRRRVLQLRPCQHGAVSRPGGAGAAPALHRAPDPAPSGDGQAAVHRTARHFDGEQRGVHARHGQKFPPARSGGYDGGGLREDRSAHRIRPDGCRRGGFRPHLATYI